MTRSYGLSSTFTMKQPEREPIVYSFFSIYKTKDKMSFWEFGMVPSHLWCKIMLIMSLQEKVKSWLFSISMYKMVFVILI